MKVFVSWLGMLNQVRIQDLCRGGGSQDFADIAQWSRGSGKNLGLKMGDQGGGRAPRIRTWLFLQGVKIVEFLIADILSTSLVTN